MSAVETVNLSEGEKNSFAGSCLERHLKSFGLDNAHESNAVICFGFVRERGDREECMVRGLHALFKRFSCQYIITHAKHLGLHVEILSLPLVTSRTLYGRPVVGWPPRYGPKEYGPGIMSAVDLVSLIRSKRA